MEEILATVDGVSQMKEYLTIEKVTNVCLFILKPLIILLVCKYLISVIHKIVMNIMDKTKLDVAIKSFANSALRVVLWLIALIFVAESLGVNTASFVTILGVVSLAFSLSVQNILTNAFSGITILITKPFSIGDYVTVGGVSGTVKAISLMRTTIATVDNKVELVPNADITGSKITNFSLEPLRRVDMTVSASYDDSTDKVKSAIMEVIDADDRIQKDRGHLPFVRLSNYNANDIEYTIRVWVNNADYWDVYFDTLENIRESFAKNGVEFSYPHVVVHK